MRLKPIYSFDEVDSFLDSSGENSKMMDSYLKSKQLTDAYSEFSEEFLSYEEAKEMQRQMDSGKYFESDIDEIYRIKEKSLSYLNKDKKAMAALHILGEYGWSLEDIG